MSKPTNPLLRWMGRGPSGIVEGPWYSASLASLHQILRRYHNFRSVRGWEFWPEPEMPSKAVRIERAAEAYQIMTELAKGGQPYVPSRPDNRPLFRWIGLSPTGQMSGPWQAVSEQALREHLRVNEGLKSTRNWQFWKQTEEEAAQILEDIQTQTKEVLQQNPWLCMADLI